MINDGPVEPRLPDFLVIGAMKSGTTSLAAILGSHPRAFVTAPKEPNYFTSEFDRGVDWYRDLFAGAPPGAALGEASTSYAKFPVHDPAARAHALVPDATIVYLVREPLARLVSQWKHLRTNHRTDLPLEQAVRELPQLVDLSRYRTQLDRWRAHYPDEQILVHTTDQLHADGRAVAASVLRAAGLDDPMRDMPAAVHTHRSDAKRLWPHWAARLRKRRAARLAFAHLPRPVTSTLRTRYPLAGDALTDTLSDDLAGELRDELRPEVEGLRPWLGDAWDGWGML